ncbi:hypothetical protein LJR045_000506 [Microbacterium sp. LjRoot45]|uniref:hypothetical protein n=1 Tax=Microbacterium sp. LjRoot45 TaxID=3342329 RepID=UPI003ECD6E5E
MRRRLAAASAVALALVLTACATGAPMPDQSSSRPPFQTTTPGAVGPSGTPAAVPADRWTAIQDDLAARGVTGEATVVSSEQVTFSDGSLGCAEPGQSYTQAIIDGMRVVVAVDGTSYDYRFGEGTDLKLCTR